MILIVKFYYIDDVLEGDDQLNSNSSVLLSYQMNRAHTAATIHILKRLIEMHHKKIKCEHDNVLISPRKSLLDINSPIYFVTSVRVCISI